MPLSRLTTRVRRIEGSVGVRCPACAHRPEFGILFEYEGRLTDGHGNDIDPGWLEPCPRCGKRGGAQHGIKIIAGVDPTALL